MVSLIIDVLLQSGVDIDGANSSMRTPFMELCFRGQGYGTPDSLEALLERGALLHWKDMNDYTARELAQRSNDQEALSVIDKWVLSKEVAPKHTSKSTRLM